MPLQEFTAQLPVGSPQNRSTMEFNVVVKLDSFEIFDIYTTKDGYEELPKTLKQLTWELRQNPLFIHVIAKDIKSAWAYLTHHAFLDDELENIVS